MTELRFRINQTKVVMAAKDYKENWKKAKEKNACGKFAKVDPFDAYELIRQSREKLFKAVDRLNGGPGT